MACCDDYYYGRKNHKLLISIEMPKAGRTPRALSVMTALGLAATISAQAHLVADAVFAERAGPHFSLPPV